MPTRSGFIPRAFVIDYIFSFTIDFNCGLRIASSKNMIYHENFLIKEDSSMKTTKEES